MTSVLPPLPPPTRRRVVLHVPGYEPLDTAGQERRLRRVLTQSATVWSLRLETSMAKTSDDGVVRAFAARMAGPGWATAAEIRILGWHDLVARDLEVPLPVRMLRGAGALVALLANGTLGRYRAAHWRYLLFALLPVAMLAGALLAGMLAALAAGGWMGLALGVAVAAGLLWLADRRAHLGHLCADWVFARDLARGQRAEVTARIARFAEEVAAARRLEDVDEVVLTGHSLGMVLLAEALASSIAARHGGPRLVLVGLGSSLLKLALMPQAGRLRAAVGQIAAAPGLAWVEFTSRRDLVSFHRADPVRVLGLPGQGPRMDAIHPRNMLDAAGWRRVRISMLRAHRIYVTGIGRRYFFDWGMIACGPGAIGRDPTPDRLIRPDGTITAVPQRRAA